MTLLVTWFFFSFFLKPHLTDCGILAFQPGIEPWAPAVQFSSVAQSCLTLCDPWTAGSQASRSITNSQSLPRLMSTESVMPSKHLILYQPFSSCLQSFQHQGFFKWVSSSYQVAKVLELQLHQFFQWTPRTDLIWMDWFDLLAVQGTLKSLLQHHSSKASILLCSAFFIVQLSHPYMTIGKTITLIAWTFVGKLMSLLFNTLSRLVITFLPRSKCLFISWLQAPSAVILKPPRIKSLAPFKYHAYTDRQYPDEWLVFLLLSVVLFIVG